MVGNTGNVGMVKKIIFNRGNVITDFIHQLCVTIRENSGNYYKGKLIWFTVLEVQVQERCLNLCVLW